MKNPDNRTTLGPAGNGKSRPARGDVNARVLERIRAAAAIVRIRQEGLYDRLAQRYRAAIAEAADRSRESERMAVEKARAELVDAGALTPKQGERLKAFLLRDLDPADTRRRTGDITGAGTLACTACGISLRFRDTGTVPPCPKCAATEFARNG